MPIDAVHVTVFSRDAEATRAFFRDVLELDSVDAGGGWLIFALPPAELGVHPTDGPPRHERPRRADRPGRGGQSSSLAVRPIGVLTRCVDNAQPPIS